MKRKVEFREEETPPPKKSNNGPSQNLEIESTESFDSLLLDPRLLLAVQSQKFPAPTPIQSHAIPILLSGKSLLARARTGSGKTAAYVLPILQQLLERKSDSLGESKQISALILVPTRELAGQVSRVVEEFARHCGIIRVENLARKEDVKVQRARIQSGPDIIVCTPGRVVEHLNGLKLDGIKTLVVDEADLASEYGYMDDLSTISKSLPNGVQVVLMSATLRTDSEGIRDVFKGEMEILELDEEKEEEAKVKQYMVHCAEDEKFLLCYAIFILKLVKGKTIIFVGDIDRCYKVKLFLEQFGIRGCVLNSELPVNSRVHVVEEFNRNVYDIIIATDEFQTAVMDNDKPIAVNAGEDVQQTSQSKLKGKKLSKDSSYGVSRGVDFHSVSLILNFDLPPSSISYTHRIGRTGRAGRSGMALSFVVPSDQFRKHKPTSTPASANDEAVLANIIATQAELGNKIEPYQFDMVKLEGFRYRLASALKAVTLGAVREARLRELRQELINSEKLKRHFEENPTDLKHLRHDGELRPAKVQAHMKHVPDYLVPGGSKTIQEEIGFVSLHKSSERRKSGKFNHGKSKGKVNPLQSFKSKRSK